MFLTSSCSVLSQGRLQSQDSGKHLHDVEDLLQTHNLVEADISAQAEGVRGVQGAAQRFTSDQQGETTDLRTLTNIHMTVSYCVRVIMVKIAFDDYALCSFHASRNL